MKAIARQGGALALVVLGASFTVTCYEDRVTGSASPTYRTEVQAILEQRCVQCHGDANPAGGWRATSFLGAIGCATNDKIVTLPTDDSAPLLKALATDTHKQVLPDSERAVIASWVKAGTPAFPDGVHPSGFADPRSPDFHAKALRAANWRPIRDVNDEHVCGRCHEGAPVRPESADLGAPGATACTTCHTDPQGALGCTTCHGDPARGAGRAAPPRDKCFFSFPSSASAQDPATSGAHQAHVLGNGVRTGGMQCAVCHPTPTEGHVFEGTHANGAIDVAFDPSVTTGAFDAKSLTCTVKCHDRGGAKPTPRWNDAIGPLKCGDCHGAPPAQHYPGACTTCHREAAADGTGRTAGPMHLNGKVDLGDGSGKCGACHGLGDDPFPRTRAHPAHENPTITTPVDCVTCHPITATPPQNIKTPGHMDGKVEIVFTGRALSRNAQPKWDGAACSQVACHGANLPETPAVATQQWADATHAPAKCGACHNIPPTWGHTTAVTCNASNCHGPIIALDPNNVPSITPFGKTLHINGVVDRY